MHPRRSSLYLLLPLALLPSCLPVETITAVNPLEAELTDDAAPPAAQYDATLEFTGAYGPENNSAQRFRFDIAPFNDEAERAAADQLHRSHAALLQANPSAIPSVQTLGTYLKQLDDSIYAGVELAVQQGLQPSLEPKRELLSLVLTHLLNHRSAAADEAIAYLAAAMQLGGTARTLPDDLTPALQAAMERFLATPEAKPLGFYTWSAELQAIWQQDRMLQTAVNGEAACAIAGALVSDPALRARYGQLVQLASKLTNPIKAEHALVAILDAAAAGTCSSLPRPFLGPSRSAEVDLFELLYPNGLPENVDLMQALITAIRDDTLDLTPSAEAGWYAHQTYALETLLVTDRAEERAKVAFTARYKRRLQEAFATMLTQNRETHVKQLSPYDLTSMGPPLVPHPRLEPLATVYARQARAYVFLETALDEVMGAALLDVGVAAVAAGPLSETLRQRIARARDLAFGLYALSCQDIGLHPSLPEASDPSFATLWNDLAQRAATVVSGLAADPIADADVRVIVPIAKITEQCFRYWAVVGVRTTLAGYSYLEGDDMGVPAADKLARLPLPTEQFIEATSCGAPLNRDEFRALCDQHGTAAAIKAALAAR